MGHTDKLLDLGSCILFSYRQQLQSTALKPMTKRSSWYRRCITSKLTESPGCYYFCIFQCAPSASLRDRSLITEREEGGVQHGRGTNHVLPLQKKGRGRKSFNHAEWGRGGAQQVLG